MACNPPYYLGISKKSPVRIEEFEVDVNHNENQKCYQFSQGGEE